MTISVIITTYDHPDWLEKVLWGYAAQIYRDFELLVADDGSPSTTRERIERMRPEVGVPIHHVWQEHLGFRKCEVLNKAILVASGEYLFFTDGDCVPRADLLEVHASLASPGRFLSGGYIKLPLETSLRIAREDVIEGRATDARWLLAHGAPLSRRLLRLALGSRTARLCDALTPTHPTWNGHNASAWRRDIIAANGFDERMRYGGLDRELGVRLENAGIKGLQVRHRAAVVHLDHARGYRDAAAMRRNLQIRRETAASGRTRAVVGLSQHATGDDVAAGNPAEPSHPAS